MGKHTILLQIYYLLVEPYSSAVHYWPLTKIEKEKNNISKDKCGKTDAKVSDGVTTKIDPQLGSVVSLNTKSASLVITLLQFRCIYDPSHSKNGITIEFWLKFQRGIRSVRKRFSPCEDHKL